MQQFLVPASQTRECAAFSLLYHCKLQVFSRRIFDNECLHRTDNTESLLSRTESVAFSSGATLVSCAVIHITFSLKVY